MSNTRHDQSQRPATAAAMAGRTEVSNGGAAEQVSADQEPQTVDPSEAKPADAAVIRHLMIRASAGSGKTYQLMLRYLRRLLDGVPVEQILASTFTRKAAGEILERVLGTLAKVIHDDDERRKLGGHLGTPGLRREDCERLLISLTRSLHRVRVSTLDSFFARLATSYTLELGLPPGWELIDELADEKLRRQAINEILQSERTSKTQRLANLLARGDSGRRVSSLIQDAVRTYYDVYRRTTAAAWRAFPDLKPLSSERLAEALRDFESMERPNDSRIETTIQKDLAAAAEGDWVGFFSRKLTRNILDGELTFCRKPITSSMREAYQTLIDHAVATLTSEVATQTAATYELLKSFDDAYQRLKHDARGLRFDDVTDRLAEYLSTDDAASGMLPQLAFRLDSDVSHLLLDEFQDTSLAQWNVMRPFAERITQTEHEASFFCVGDVKQAIYGWRGGVAEMFDAVDQQLPGIVSSSLERSYRSSKVVIDFVNELFRMLPRHSNLGNAESTIRDWCAAVKPHSTELRSAGYVTLETGPLPSDEDGEGPGLVDGILDCAANRVQQVAASAPLATIGVLVRANSSISKLVSMLRKRGVDASEESGNPLTDSAAVMLILSLIRLSDHPGDTIARHHVATSPLGPALHLATDSDEPQSDRIAADIRRALVDDGYGETIDRLARILLPHCNRRELTRLGQLVDLAYVYGEQSSLRPGDFISFVRMERVKDPSAARVRVMTVHQAKGLEFDAVVLALIDRSLIAVSPAYVTHTPSPSEPPDVVSIYRNECIRSVLPPRIQQAFTDTEAARIREELCVLYVAVTRAAHALHIVILPSIGTEKKLPKSASGLVRAALTNGERVLPSTLLLELGDPDWADLNSLMKEHGGADHKDSHSATVRPVVKLAEMPDGRTRGLGRLAPSQNAAPQHVRLSELLRSDQQGALDRGSLFHAWFEQIDWLDDGPPAETLLRRIAVRRGFDPTTIDLHVQEFLQMVERPDIAKLLTRQSYLSLEQPPLPQPVIDELATGPFDLDVSRERPVATRLEGELMTGSIDRLVLVRRDFQVLAADIIDFKTDVVGPGGAADLDRMAHYRRQLESYSAAIRRIYRLSPQRITTRLLFVESGQIVLV